MILSNTLTAALDCMGLDAGAGAPTVGISPANADTEMRQINVTAKRNLFIDNSPLRLKRCKAFYIELNSTTTQASLQGSGSRTTIRLPYLGHSLHEGCYFFNADCLAKAKAGPILLLPLKFYSVLAY